jgi:hypothetical protein
MRGPQDHASFLAGWTRRFDDMKARAEKKYGVTGSDRGLAPAQAPLTEKDLLEHARKSGFGGGGQPQSSLGTNHRLAIDLSGFPKGTRTKYAGDEGLFKTVTLNRGRQMGNASQTS